MSMSRSRLLGTVLAAGLAIAVATGPGSVPATAAEPAPAPPAGRDRDAAKASMVANRPLSVSSAPQGVSAARPGEPKPTAAAGSPFALDDPQQVMKSVQTVGLFALISLAPAAVLMVTAFVRINIVLILLRQALGSPQVPGNQVLTALALLLTALVMKPWADEVYTKAIVPYANGKATPAQAWEAGSKPVKAFMVQQIERTNHHDYLWQLYDYVDPPRPGRIDPKYGADFPLRAVAPAFLLSELKTALVIGFYLYLPFLVIDLVVSAVLAAMGLFMLPPSLVALPLKLILFAMADGWLLVATKLLESFAIPSSA